MEKPDPQVVWPDGRHGLVVVLRHADIENAHADDRRVEAHLPVPLVERQETEAGSGHLGPPLAREAAVDPSLVEFFALHGATDAPTVDVIARGVATLVDDAAYGDMPPSFAVPAASYTLDITPAMDNNTVVASFTADLSGLAGGAAVVFASGFLAPMNNQNGPAFGLFAALPDGNVVALPAYKDPMARLQVIHNAADPGAALVDLYVNGTLFQDDFAFRAATPFSGCDLETLRDAYLFLDSRGECEPALLTNLAVAFHFERRPADAVSLFEASLRRNRDSMTARAGLAQSALDLGDTLRARTLADELESCALAAWGLGDHELAVGLLERAVQAGAHRQWLRDSALYDEWRGDPGFAVVLGDGVGE